MSHHVHVFGLTHVGRVRLNNEDEWAAVPDCSFFVLADGMGGHRAGEVASKEAVQSLCHIIQKQASEQKSSISLQEAEDQLREAIEQTNDRIYKLSHKNTACRGMGTTLCCLHFIDSGVVMAHVGDSRIYRLRKERLVQLTKDHSLLRELVDLGQVEEKQGGENSYKNILTKAVGTESEVEPSIQFQEIFKSDLYLMCSDGLTDHLSKKEIESILNKNTDLETTVKILIATANEKGGHDNITVVLIQVD